MNECKACKSWDGRHETRTKHMLAFAKSCVLHLCKAVRSTNSKGRAKTTTLQKKGVQSGSTRIFTRIRKNTPLFHENTPLFHFFFHFSVFIFPWDFRLKKSPRRKNQKKVNLCPWILGILCNFFSGSFLLGRWTKTPAALKVKTNKLQG